MLKKTLKIFRNSFLFLVIFSVLFSNIPFYALTSVIKESSRVANIVDKAWNLSQDDNIVDKFNSLNEVAGWVKIHEARAAVALRGANKQGSGTNGSDITLTFDTGGGAPQTGDVVILYGGRGNTSDAQAFGPITSGYTPIATINSTGPKFGVWYKVMGVTPDTTVQGEGGASTAHGVAYGAYVIDGTTIDPAIFDQVAVSTGQLSSWVPNGPAIVTQTDGAFVVTHAANSVIDTSRGTVSGYTLFTAAAGNDSNDINIQTAYVVAGAPGTYDPPAWSAWTAGIGGAVTIAFKPAPTLTTTSLSNFVSAEPGNSTVAPGSAGYVDSFGLATNSGSDTVTGATVTLAAGTGARVATVAITNDGDTVTYCSATPSGDTATLTSCGIPVTTTNTQFKIRITAISHGSMPAVPGASYAVTGTVTAFTSTNPQAGTDSGSSTLTIDNLSPGNVTGAGGSVDNGQVTTSWTNPVDADYHSAVVLRREAVAVADVPVEGTTYIVGNTIGTAIVACVVATPTATCNDTGLTNGTAYHYEIFTKDTNGNYDVGVVPTGSPFTPVPTRTYYGYLNSGTAVTLPAVTTNAVCPVASDTNLGTVSGISLLDDVDDATCIPGATRDIIWSSSAPTFSFYYNGAGYASAMDVTGVSIGFRARSQSASAILTLKLFYTEPGGAKVYFTGTPPTQALTATRTEFTVSLAGLSATGVPAGSKLGVEFSWDDPLGVRISMNATANSEKLIVTETVAAVTLSVDGYTNETEAGLNYTASCTGCGARIGGGAGFRQTVTIAGIGFGADPGVGNRSSATNNIKIGAQQIASANVTAWSATSITFLTDSAVAGDTDTDWGAEFGGTSALTVTASGATSAGLNFYVFPQVTSLSTCNSAGFPVGDGAREYNASDSVCPNGLTDGEIFLNGTRFGTASTGGYVQIFGIGATTPSWTNELIRARVPSSALYTGSLVVQQGVGSNNKTHTYTSTNFRIFPRITDFVPTSGSEGNSVTINGNHFCQGAGCPVAFDANNKVVFTSAVQATVFTSWSATSIVTAIPTGAVSGDVVVTSNSYTSNGKVFTVLSNTPTPPISLNQWKNSGLTQVIAVSGVASSTPLYLTMIMEVPGISGGTLYPQVEYKAIGTAFTCGAGACVSAIEGSGVAGPGPVDCGIVGNTCAISITPADEVYHWQARVRHNKGGSDYYSAWVSFDDVNPETSTDFQIDTTAPGITSVSSGTPGTNSATITWNTLSEISTSRVEYDTSGTFIGGYDCAGTSECTALADTSPRVNAHSVAFSNLSSGTTYYYRVRSKDAAGNESISSNYSFTTASISQPAKTTKAYIDGAVGVVSAETTYYFTLNLPETTPAVQNSYVELFGVVSGGSGTITLQVNGAPARAYAVEATSPTLYRFLYRIPSPGTEANLNIEDAAPCTNGNPLGTPPCNKAIITPATVSMYVLSARIITTYAYTP